MSPLDLAGLVGVALFLLPQTLFFAFYSLLGLYSKRYSEKRGSEAYLGETVSIIIPVKGEPPDYVEAALKRVSELSSTVNVEVIVVSDDPPEFLEYLRRLVDEWRGRLRVYYVWRSEPRGFRAGALNVGLSASTGEYVYVMDVDSFFDPCLVLRGVSLLKSSERLAGVVGRWSVWNKGSRLSEALAYNMEYVVNVLFKARSALSLDIFPLGTGTLFKASVLKGLGGWDEERIQDDMDLGVRLYGMGYRVEYIDSCRVYVEAPTRYSSLRVQQERWAYGATDVLLARLGALLRSPVSLVSKFESALFLSQYTVVLLLWVGFAVTVAASLLGGVDYAAKYALVAGAWLFSQALFAAVEAHTLRAGLRESAVNQGRLAAVTVALSVPILRGVAKALARVRQEYKRTPKGLFERRLRGKGVSGELALLVALAVVLSLVALRRYVLLSLITGMYTVSVVYTLIRWPRDIIGLK
ncbi:glycosyltransferase family 2 protein [Thermogladius sp. KZ2Tp1]|uniref:glycosyltransferase n=1 Tax=Thermogladius sp. KZ2Tp1 TaxID=3136289 RepID=UPI003DA95168